MTFPRALRPALAAALLAAAFSAPAAAPLSAQELAQAGDSGLSDAEINRRLRFLERRLDDSKLHGQAWHWGWLTINGSAMVGFGAAAAATGDHDDTVKLSVNAAKGAIGTARILLDPLEARKGADPIRALPEATREEKLAKLAAAEDQLRRNAKRVDKRWSWRRHTGNAVVNAASGAIVAALGETGHAYEVGIAGFVAGLAKIFTEPWAPKQDWKDYQKLTGAQTSNLDLDVYVTALPEGAAVNFRLSW